MRAKSMWRAGAAIVAVAIGALAAAVPASAHVTVNAATAVQGGYAKLAFRVPNEKATAKTVKLEVVLPADAPIANVSIKPVPGWTAVVEKAKLATPIQVHGSDVTEAPSKITWTAQSGAEIGSGQFQEFEVSAGPLPKVDKLVFKALQTYSDGDVVRWIEVGDGDLDKPAPVLKLTAPAASASPSAAAVASSTEDKAGGVSAWEIAALVLAAAALLVAGLAWRRARPVPA